MEDKWDAEFYTQKHDFVFNYGDNLLDLLNPKPGELILDLGCGTGQLTQKINDISGQAIGIDASVEMIEFAKKKYPNVQFVVGRAEDFKWPEKFDAIFSNATLHWVLNYEEAIAQMFKHLKVGGRLVLEMGGDGNVQKILQSLRKHLEAKGYLEQAAYVQWFFPSIGRYSSALEKHGFRVTYAHLFDRPTELANPKTGIIDWLTMFAFSFFVDVPTEEQRIIKEHVQKDLEATCLENGKLFADYKRLRIIALKV